MMIVESAHTNMNLTDELPEIPTTSRHHHHRVKIKAPKSGSDRLELVLDDDRDDNTDNNLKNNNYGIDDDDNDECRQTYPTDNNHNSYFFDDKFPESLYKECTSSHSASTTETDNRVSARTTSSSGSAGSSLGRTWSMESGADDDEEDDYGKAINIDDKYSSGGVGDKYGGCEGGDLVDAMEEGVGRKHQMNQTEVEHLNVESSIDPVTNLELNSDIDKEDQFQGIYQKQQQQREQCEKMESFTQGNTVGTNLSSDVDPAFVRAINGEYDGNFAVEKPFQVSSGGTGLNFQTSSSDPTAKPEIVNHNRQPVTRSDSMEWSEDTSVESVGWKVTSALKQETLPRSESRENEIKGVLRIETRYSPRKSRSNTVSAPNVHATDTSRVARIGGSASNDDACLGNKVDDGHPPVYRSTHDLDHKENVVLTTQPDYSSSKAAAMSNNENIRRGHHKNTQKTPTPRVSAPGHDAVNYRQQPEQHPHAQHQQQPQHQHHHRRGRRSSSSGALVSSSSRSIATGRSDVAISPSPLINHHQRRREGRKGGRVRWQHSRNRSDGGGAVFDTQVEEDYPQFPAIQHSHSNVSSRSAATSAYSNAALDGYVDPGDDRRTCSGGKALRLGTRVMSTARTCRRSVTSALGNAFSRGKKSLTKDKKSMNENTDSQRQQIRPQKMTIEQTNHRYFYNDQSTSRPNTEYHFEGYDHLKSSVGATSPRPSSRNRNEYKVPTSEHQLLGNVNDEIRTDDNPWANDTGVNVAGKYDNNTPCSNAYNDNEPNPFMSNKNDELPPPTGQMNMAGLSMPVFKWWTWRQKENMQELHPGPRGMQIPGQEQDGDCTYFAFMCMFPTADTVAGRN